LAAEALLTASPEVQAIVDALPLLSSLGNATFGSCADPLFVFPRLDDSTMISVCMDEGVCGRRVFNADQSKMFSCMTCR
jgi:hypothetical protein